MDQLVKTNKLTPLNLQPCPVNPHTPPLSLFLSLVLGEDENGVAPIFILFGDRFNVKIFRYIYKI